MTNQLQQPFSIPAGATEVVLVRHGSVTFSGDGLAGGGEDPPLTPAGHTQAHAVAGLLEHEPVHALFTSPLLRARETATPIADAIGLHPVVVDQLREVALGAWEGQLSRRLAQGGPLAKRLFIDERWDVIPGAEPAGRFEARVRRSLAEVVTAAGPDAVAVAVVHGGVIAEACRQVTGSRGFAFLGAENGSISRLIHRTDGSWALRSFNDTAHLRAALSAVPSAERRRGERPRR